MVKGITEGSKVISTDVGPQSLLPFREQEEDNQSRECKLPSKVVASREAVFTVSRSNKAAAMA
jgi:hypothetical protein